MQKVLDHFYDFISANSRVSLEERAFLSPYIEVCDASKKELVRSSIDNTNYLYFIYSGLFRLYDVDDSGREMTIGFLTETDFYIDLESVLSKCSSNTILECIEASQYIRIPYYRLQEAYDKSHAMEQFGRMMVERAFMKFLNFIHLSRLPQPEQRYEAFEKEHPEIANRIPQKILASFIGITPESLSRIRKRRVSG